MKYRNLIITIAVVISVISVLVVKTFNIYEPSDLPDLHAKNQNYQAAINLAIKNHQPIFIEFFGEY